MIDWKKTEIKKWIQLNDPIVFFSHLMITQSMITKIDRNLGFDKKHAHYKK